MTSQTKSGESNRQSHPALGLQMQSMPFPLPCSVIVDRKYNYSFFSSRLVLLQLWYYSSSTFQFPFALPQMVGSVGSNPSSTSELRSAKRTAANSSLLETWGSLYHSGSSTRHVQLRDLLLETAKYIFECNWACACPFLEFLSYRMSLSRDSTICFASCLYKALAIRYPKVSYTKIIEQNLPSSS
jgi:hypothetical protein